MRCLNFGFGKVLCNEVRLNIYCRKNWLWSQATVVDMTLDEYEAIKSDLNRQGGKRNFPLLVSETIAVLELLWSMKDNDDDLVICNPSYWMHSYISQLQVFTPNKQAHLKGSEDMYKFTDAIDKLLETRPDKHHLYMCAH